MSNLQTCYLLVRRLFVDPMLSLELIDEEDLKRGDNNRPRERLSYVCKTRVLDQLDIDNVMFCLYT